MRGGALPPALLAAALSFALAFAPRRSLTWAPPIFVLAAFGASFVHLDKRWDDGVFLGCWISVVLSAAAVHLPRGLNQPTALLLALNAGVWAGTIIAVAGGPLDLAKALPWVLLALPGAWLVSRGWGLGIKVVSSWLIAVAILAATLPTTTPTPGYAADHME
ncbi:hypothetical protein BH10PSE5_BH10PSE5_12190 [soil metagenome]